MHTCIQASELRNIFDGNEFYPDEEEFFLEALQSQNPTIHIENFVGNVDVETAMQLADAGEVIGPPMGMQEFLAPLHAILVEASGGSETLEATFDEMRAGMSTTQGEIEAGRLGHYTLAPILNVYRSLKLTPEDLQEALEERLKIEKILTADFNNPEMATAALDFFRHQERSLMLKRGIEFQSSRVIVDMDVPLDPQRGGLDLGPAH